jgi:hypothetical protein
MVTPRYIAKMTRITTHSTIGYTDSAIHPLITIHARFGKLPALQVTVSNQHPNRNFILTTWKAL